MMEPIDLSTYVRCMLLVYTLYCYYDDWYIDIIVIMMMMVIPICALYVIGIYILLLL